MATAKVRLLLSMLVGSCAVTADAGCRGLEDNVFIAAAVDYYLQHRQPTGSIAYLEDGATIRRQYLPFANLTEFKSLNSDCCQILGVRDGEGAIYGAWDVWYYDVKTTVGINAMVHEGVGGAIVVTKDAPVRIPLNSCAEVVPQLMR